MTDTTQHKRINSTSHPHEALMPLLLNLKMTTCKGESRSQLVNIMQFISNKHHNIPFTQLYIFRYAYDTTDTMHVVPINRGINPPNRSTPHRDTAHQHNFHTMGNMSTNDPNLTGIQHQCI